MFMDKSLSKVHPNSDPMGEPGGADGTFMSSNLSGSLKKLFIFFWSILRWDFSRKDFPRERFNWSFNNVIDCIEIELTAGEAALLIARLIKWSKTIKSTLRFTSPANPFGAELSIEPSIIVVMTFSKPGWLLSRALYSTKRVALAGWKSTRQV